MIAESPHPVHYAGIGSRRTPIAALRELRLIAAALGRRGYILRSGGAAGADTACEQGATDAGSTTDIYLPWIGFNHRADGIIAPKLPSYAHAEEIAAAHHPAWNALTPAVRKLMTRNVMQVLGRDCLSPAGFVVCWAPGSRLDEAGRVVDVAGGTGQAVRIAATYRVPVFNLAHPPHQARVGAWLAGNP